jgi:ribosome-binding ATPase YchF (GTP1/OBG family)
MRIFFALAVDLQSMLIGVVGKPSSGKSTFLNAACLTDARTANYPFTTIEPNQGVGHVRLICACRELGVQDNPRNQLCEDGIRYIAVKMLDVAGLVPGAHEGRGLGNKFLADLVQADVLLHIVDISGSLDAEGNPVEPGTHDPLEDIAFLEREIDLWFLDILTRKDWARFTRAIEVDRRDFSEEMAERLGGVGIDRDMVLAAVRLSGLNSSQASKWNTDELFLFAQSLRKVSKPILIVANKVDSRGAKENLARVMEAHSGLVVPACGLAEYYLRKFSQSGKIKYKPGDSALSIIEDSGISEEERTACQKIQENLLGPYGSTGVQAVIDAAVFKTLKQIVVYPVADATHFTDQNGNVLPDAMLVTEGIKLREFVAKKIHTDLAKHFLHGIDARTKRQLGENYVLKNNDIVKIVSAAR